MIIRTKERTNRGGVTTHASLSFVVDKIKFLGNEIELFLRDKGDPLIIRQEYVEQIEDDDLVEGGFIFVNRNHIEEIINTYNL